MPRFGRGHLPVAIQSYHFQDLLDFGIEGVKHGDGMTAPELIANRANPLEANMGLAKWKNAVVRKGDFIKIPQSQLVRRSEITLIVDVYHGTTNALDSATSSSESAPTIRSCYRRNRRSRRTCHSLRPGAWDRS